MFYFLYLDVYFTFFDFTVAHRDRKYSEMQLIVSPVETRGQNFRGSDRQTFLKLEAVKN